MLVIAGMPILATAGGMVDGHEQTAHDQAAHDESAAHDHHTAIGHHAQMADAEDARHGESPTHANCTDAACLVSCATCSYCPGALAGDGTSLCVPVIANHPLKTLHSSPPVAALHRPPILS